MTPHSILILFPPNIWANRVNVALQNHIFPACVLQNFFSPLLVLRNTQYALRTTYHISRTPLPLAVVLQNRLFPAFVLQKILSPLVLQKRFSPLCATPYEPHSLIRYALQSSSVAVGLQSSSVAVGSADRCATEEYFPAFSYAIRNTHHAPRLALFRKK
jgi:hypothetical protein